MIKTDTKHELGIWREHIESFILSNFKPNNDLTVFDIGVGESNGIIRQIYPQLKIVDKSPHAKPQVLCDIESMAQINELEKADIVFCLEVLEHTTKPWNTPPNLFSLLKPNAKLVVSVPSFLFEHQMLPICNDNFRFMEGTLSRCLFNETSGFKELKTSICKYQEHKPLGQIAIYKRL